MNKETSLLKILKEFETITSKGYREIASSLPKDRVPIAFFCPYVPEELIHAAGLFPSVSWARPSRCPMSRPISRLTAAIWLNPPLKAYSKGSSIS